MSARSSPTSRGIVAGTICKSADRKSRAVIPYFWCSSRQNTIGRRPLSSGGIGRHRADQRIELLGADHFRLQSAPEVAVNMRRQIGDEQHRIARSVSDVDPRRRPIGFIDPARDRQRHVGPLVVLDGSVNLRVDQHGLLALAERPGLELDAR